MQNYDETRRNTTEGTYGNYASTIYTHGSEDRVEAAQLTAVESGGHEHAAGNTTEHTQQAVIRDNATVQDAGCDESVDVRKLRAYERGDATQTGTSYDTRERRGGPEGTGGKRRYAEPDGAVKTRGENTNIHREELKKRKILRMKGVTEDSSGGRQAGKYATTQNPQHL